MIEVQPYRSYKYLNQFVLKPAIEELIDLELVTITVGTKKYQRKVIGFTLHYIA